MAEKCVSLSLVGPAQFLADLLHLVVLVVDLRLLGEVLVLQVLQLGHGLINDLHVPMLFLQQKQRVRSDSFLSLNDTCHILTIVFPTLLYTAELHCELSPFYASWSFF